MQPSAAREQRQHELRQDHLAARLLLTAVGGGLALAGSATDWTHGLAGSAGPMNDGGLGGGGRYTAVLTVIVMACAGWYYARPAAPPARAGAAAAAVLFVLAVADWNTAADDVDSANHANGLFATASVAPGVWVLLAGATGALISAVWTLRVDR